MVKGKENKPVVLQVLPELEMGGVEIGTVEIAGGMQKHGITNFVASQGGRLVYDLEKIKVTGEVLEQTKGPKVRILKFKNKTGYTRRMGHRAKLTQVKITKIA